MTTPQPATPDQPDGDVQQRALAAAYAVFDKALKLASPHRFVVDEAIAAYDQVHAEHADAETDRIIAQTGFAGMDLTDDGVRFRLKHAHDYAATVVKQFDEWTRQAGCENYTETDFTVTDPDHDHLRKYQFIVVKPGGKSPHELRQQADAERDQAVARLAALHAQLAHVYDAGDHPTPEQQATFVLDRCRDVAESEATAVASVARLRSELAAIAAIAASSDPADEVEDTLRFIVRRANNALAGQDRPGAVDPTPTEQSN